MDEAKRDLGIIRRILAYRVKIEEHSANRRFGGTPIRKIDCPLASAADCESRSEGPKRSFRHVSLSSSYRPRLRCSFRYSATISPHSSWMATSVLMGTIL